MSESIEKIQFNHFELLNFLEFLDEHEYLNVFKKFYDKIPKYVADNVNSIDFEDKCQYYYLMMKNRECFTDFDS